jgi:Rrf2 family transcriptional regulator, iron-sulfur cluster assembly transcription factor
MRLEITRRADLATRALLELAAVGGRSKAAELASSIGTTAGFLSQAMTPLVSQGWVRSEPGPTGGYVAAMDLAEISVLDVIEAVEGPTDSGRCVLQDRPCSTASTCALHVPWQKARAGLLGELGATTLAEIAPKPKPKKRNR